MPISFLQLTSQQFEGPGIGVAWRVVNRESASGARLNWLTWHLEVNTFQDLRTFKVELNETAADLCDAKMLRE